VKEVLINGMRSTDLVSKKIVEVIALIANVPFEEAEIILEAASRIVRVTRERRRPSEEETLGRIVENLLAKTVAKAKLGDIPTSGV